ncbi:transposase [Rhizobium sp. WYCCWR10014]|nr:transposase [Rhizobium sp. WYCCWR10014]
MRPHLHVPQEINIFTVTAGQRFDVEEVDDGVWLVSFMRYDLGYIDLERRTLQTIENPFGTRLSPLS